MEAPLEMEVGEDAEVKPWGVVGNYMAQRKTGERRGAGRQAQ